MSIARGPVGPAIMQAVAAPARPASAPWVRSSQAPIRASVTDALAPVVGGQTVYQRAKETSMGALPSWQRGAQPGNRAV
jgi:hypothetical protein